ncbi:20061_t:CDS:10, partial [Entrophospora sp. SA101]
QWGNGLALTGFAYLVIFDAMGIFTIFISTVLITYRSLREPTIKNPFGVQRYEILFGFINILYLLFVALYILKEGLEHLLLETSEEHYDHNFVFPLYWVILALGVTLISAINYRNHKGFLLICGISVIIVGKLMEKKYYKRWLDKVVSIIESMLMFYLACPIATSLGKILLQTTPDSISMYLEDYLREANEQIVLKHVYQKLSPLLVNHNNGEKEGHILDDELFGVCEMFQSTVKKNKDVKEQGLPQIPEYAEDSSNSIATRYERGELLCESIDHVYSELKKLKLNNREDLMIRKPKSLYESAYGPGEGKYKGTNEIESTV